jgi:transaldolase
MTNPLINLQRLGQSPWHDNIRRGLLTSGELEKMVQEGDITGLTSNPTIFEQAISQSNDYSAAMTRLAQQGKEPNEIFDQLSTEDIRAAADVFKPIYERTNNSDGYVSIEVAPRYADDTGMTIDEAHRLWQVIDRPNLMIKIPATLAGLPAIQQSIADGMNVNVTLIFSLQRYQEVMDAYLAGLEQRLASGKPIRNIASVASFFISRVDSLVDKLLDETIKTGGKAEILQILKGQAAIANAKLAYAGFKTQFGSDRFQRLSRQGAQVQRPLWASTSTKNPAYSDVYYVEALIGADTVNTMPPQTIVAYKDHGQPAARLEDDLDGAHHVISQLETFGIRMDEVTQQLEIEGVASFNRSYEKLMTVVTTQCKTARQ